MDGAEMHRRFSSSTSHPKGFEVAMGKNEGRAYDLEILVVCCRMFNFSKQSLRLNTTYLSATK